MAEPPPDDAEDVAPSRPQAPEVVKDHPRGYTGWIYEDVFKDLYQPKPAEEEQEEDPDADQEAAAAEVAAAAEAAAAAGGAPEEDDGEIDITGEDDEIARIHAHLADEHVRLSSEVDDLRSKQEQAISLDMADARQLQEDHNLMRREQVPVPDSTLRFLLDPDHLDEEGLIAPRSIMEPGEREVEIKKGTIPMHDNKLAVSKPDEPNYYRKTASIRIRETNRNVQPKYSEAQRTRLADQIDERNRTRPPLPMGLSAEERDKNRKIVKKMMMKVAFLKNPRSLQDRNAGQKGEACPFWFSPDQVIFRNYEVGAVYEMMVEFRNVTKIGRRLRVTSSGNPVFSITALWLQGGEPTKDTDATSVIAPGMAAFVTVRFAPSSLGEETSQLNVGTEIGDWQLPVLARRVQPELVYEEPVNCGCTLAGTASTQIVRLTNKGGEGSFRLVVPPEEEGGVSTYHYETDEEGVATFVSETFQVSPASFYLEAGSFIDVEVRFAAAHVGKHRCPLLVECDNNMKTPLTLEAITDAARLELERWPTRQREVEPQEAPKGVSPWSLVPWQLNWLGTAAQVGGSEQQQVVISNGGYLPMKIEWRLALPPKALLSRLAVGHLTRLTEDLVAEVHEWEHCGAGSDACPFEVSPKEVTLAPFHKETFTFTYHARAPVGRRQAAFAYLVAKELPTKGRCLLHLDELLALQREMAPREYRPGAPLFGGANGDAFFEHSLDDKASCTISAVCLQGMSSPPTVACLPRVLSFVGDVLPYIAHSREVVLRNSGGRPARFRVRLTSSASSAEGPLWVVCSDEVGKPALPEPPQSDEYDEKMAYVAQCMHALSPPLPPEAGGHPGAGAIGTALVEPHEGVIAAGESITLRVTIRILRESDLNAQLMVDLPVGLEAGSRMAAAPLKINLTASVRSPRVELRRTSFIDYGVVRAHSRHTAKLLVDNPTDMPMLVKLRHHREEETTTPQTFPVVSHDEVVDVFTRMMSQASTRTASVLSGGAAIASEDAYEAPIEPWVRATSSCIDFSGRRRFTVTSLDGANQAPLEERGLPDKEDFIFKPACVVLWPRSSAEVEVTLRTGDAGKFRALLEAVGFDSGHTQFVEVYAEVQLPRLRLSTQHAKFDITYLKTPSEQLALTLRNDSDMPAPFSWAVPSTGEEPLRVKLDPPQGIIPPRSSASATLVVVPNREADCAEMPCKLFVHELMHPLVLKVQAQVFGSEVDYTVIRPGELPPEITHLPRKICQEVCPTHKVLCGKASRTSALVDYGSMEVQGTKSIQVVLYNRTGIATQFVARVAKNPSHDPNKVANVAGKLGMKTAAPAPAMIQDQKLQPPQGEHAAIALDRLMFTAEPQAVGGRSPDDDSTLRPEERIGGQTDKENLRKFEPKSRSKVSVVGNSPRASAFGKKSSKLSAGKPRRKMLLDDKHEKQAFRSAEGGDFAKAKEAKEKCLAALTAGRGHAVTVEPEIGWLKPFGRAVVTMTCFSDLPGSMEDDLVLGIKELKGHDEGDFRVPVRLHTTGSPLYLPDQQVGLDNTASPPRLLCGTLVPAEKMVQRVFKVGNNSAAKMHIVWKVYGKTQLDDMGESRQFVSIALCKNKADVMDPFNPPKGQKAIDSEDEDDLEDFGLPLPPNDDDPDEPEPFKFNIWAEEPPEVKDPFALGASSDLPVRIEPEEAVIPVHGTVSFTVTMLASKVTAGSGGHYRYKLVGKGRFTEDREQLLAAAQREAAEADANFGRSVPQLQDAGSARTAPADARASQVRNLPNYEEDSDEDEEEEDEGTHEHNAEPVSGAADARPTGGKELKPLSKMPDTDVISTIVVECVGDCIRPRLTVDKKAHPSHEEFPPGIEVHDLEGGQKGPGNVPVFKFMHAVVPPAHAPKGERHEAGGMLLGGAMGGYQGAGAVSCMVRQVTLVNHNACDLPCRFRIEGPFRIQEISLVGHYPVKAPPLDDGKGKKKKVDHLEESPLARLFKVPKQETIALKVEFVPDMIPASGWQDHKSENIFDGDLIVEYPSEISDPRHPGGPTDLQRIKLSAASRRPAVRLDVVPSYALDRKLRIEKCDRPPWSSQQPVVVEFGFVHVEAASARRRVVLLSNTTNNMAVWQLMHVGRKRRPPHEIGVTLREDEEFRALDEKGAFEFDVSLGDLRGPSKDGLTIDGQRMPRWSPITPALPHLVPEADEHLYEPQKLTITFKPRKNELYRCRFRIQVENGKSIDFECRGCGSYDEEDDEIDFQEA